MRCEIFKRATSLLALFATAALSAVYSVNISNETDRDLYYRIRIQSHLSTVTYFLVYSEKKEPAGSGDSQTCRLLSY